MHWAAAADAWSLPTLVEGFLVYFPYSSSLTRRTTTRCKQACCAAKHTWLLLRTAQGCGELKRRCPWQLAAVASALAVKPERRGKANASGRLMQVVAADTRMRAFCPGVGRQRLALSSLVALRESGRAQRALIAAQAALRCKTRSGYLDSDLTKLR